MGSGHPLRICPAIRLHVGSGSRLPLARGHQVALCTPCIPLSCQLLAQLLVQRIQLVLHSTAVYATPSCPSSLGLWKVFDGQLCLLHMSCLCSGAGVQSQSSARQYSDAHGMHCLRVPAYGTCHRADFDPQPRLMSATLHVLTGLTRATRSTASS